MNQTINRYSGDPRIVISPRGATMKVTGGQPVMDGGFENAVLISLFSREWFANMFLPKESRLYSFFEIAHDKPITKSSLVDISKAGEQDLKWLIDDGIFSKIEVETTNTADNKIFTTFDLWLFDETYVKLEVTKTGQNWLYQMTYPASERI